MTPAKLYSFSSFGYQVNAIQVQVPLWEEINKEMRCHSTQYHSAKYKTYHENKIVVQKEID